nr:translation initiation factor IF-2-like [Manis javanica]
MAEFPLRDEESLGLTGAVCAPLAPPQSPGSPATRPRLRAHPSLPGRTTDPKRSTATRWSKAGNASRGTGAAGAGPGLFQAERPRRAARPQPLGSERVSSPPPPSFLLLSPGPATPKAVRGLPLPGERARRFGELLGAPVWSRRATHPASRQESAWDPEGPSPVTCHQCHFHSSSESSESLAQSLNSPLECKHCGGRDCVCLVHPSQGT